MRNGNDRYATNLECVKIITLYYLGTDLNPKLNINKLIVQSAYEFNFTIK